MSWMTDERAAAQILRGLYNNHNQNQVAGRFGCDTDL
jgi:hypothetical protein